jgi:hypothetical protein
MMYRQNYTIDPEIRTNVAIFTKAKARVAKFANSHPGIFSIKNSNPPLHRERDRTTKDLGKTSFQTTSTQNKQRKSHTYSPPRGME